MSFFDELDAITLDAIETFGRAANGRPLWLIWNGLAIACYEEDETTKLELVAGGLIEQTDTVVRARKVDFGVALPKKNQSAVLRDGGADKPLKIRHAVTSHGDPELRVALMGAHQRD